MNALDEEFEKKNDMLKKHFSECGEHERSTRNHWKAFVEQLDERGFFSEGPGANQKPLTSDEIEAFRIRNRSNLIETKINSAESVDALFVLQTKLDNALTDIQVIKRNGHLALVLVAVLLLGLFWSGAIK